MMHVDLSVSGTSSDIDEHNGAAAAALPWDALRERLSELADIEGAASLLAWDQQTMMPAGGAPARADQLATLERLHHERLTAPEVGGWLEAIGASAGGAGEDHTPASDPSVAADRDVALMRVARRDRDKALRVPGSLLAELARAGSHGQLAWMEARAANDLGALLPHLRTLIDLRRRYIECFPEFDHPYDALLDDYEPEMRTARLRAVFAELRDGLVPLVAAIADARAAGHAPRPLEGPFPEGGQRRVLAEVLARTGLDPARFRLDDSAHPFSIGVALDDQRITTRYAEDSLESLFAGLHEFGHALYESQISPDLARTPLCAAVSLGIHESQSRLWENMIGRGLPFCEFVLPHLVASFPDALGDFGPAELHRRVNVVRPTLIRTEADEVTYSLHVIVRFELEVELFEGTLEPAGLPERWNERMHSYLGVEVPDDAHGVLQDIHWSGGAFGYFPTYALGNLIAAQLWAGLRADLPGLDDRVAAGDFEALREWLGLHVHRYGRMFTPAQTLQRAVGAELDPKPFLDYLWRKHAGIHALRGESSTAGTTAGPAVSAAGP